MDLLALNPESLRLIQETVRREVRQVQNTRQRPWYPPGDEIRAPQVRIALVPPEGIPAAQLAFFTGTGSGTGAQHLPGKTNCELYKIDIIAGEEILLDTGDAVDVYNVGSRAVAGNQFVPVWRSRSGQWLAADTLTHAGTGTGTGTGTGGVSFTFNSYNSTFLTFVDNSLVVTNNYDTVTFNIDNGVITNISVVDNVTNITTLLPADVARMVCGQQCEKWWCIDPLITGTGATTGTGTGSGAADRYCFFGLEQDMEAELERVGGSLAGGPFDSQQACEDDCLHQRVWWCVTPDGSTGTGSGTGTGIVRDGCRGIVGSYIPTSIPFTFFGPSCVYIPPSGFDLSYDSTINRWVREANAGGVLPFKFLRLEMWCSQADGLFHMDSKCDGVLVSSVTGDYAEQPGYIVFTLQGTCNFCLMTGSRITILAPDLPGTGTGTGTGSGGIPAHPFCFFGSHDEANALATSIGGTTKFTGPFASQAACNAFCGSGTGTGSGSPGPICGYPFSSVSLSVAGITDAPIPPPFDPPCTSMNGDYTLDLTAVVDTWCYYYTAQTGQECQSGDVRHRWVFAGGVSIMLLGSMASGDGAAVHAARWDIDGTFDGALGAANTWHLAASQCCDNLPASLTTVNSLT